MNYDVIIIGAGPGGIFSAYELSKLNPSLKIAVFEAGHALAKRKCPIDGEKIKSCIECKSCSIMSGFGGAGAFSENPVLGFLFCAERYIPAATEERKNFSLRLA